MSVRSYLDHNATSPLRPEARGALIDAFDRAGNPSFIHAEGRGARAIIENARETVAVTFTSGGTEAANWLLQHRDGPKLALSAVEHPCVLKGHRFADGDVHAIPVSPEGIVEFGALEEALSLAAIVAVQAVLSSGSWPLWQKSAVGARRAARRRVTDARNGYDKSEE